MNVAASVYVGRGIMTRKEIFGWNWRTWNEPFVQAIRDCPISEGLDILEIGAGRLSALSLFFASTNNRILITTYPCKMLDDVRQLVAQAMSLGGFVAKVEVACMCVKDVVGRYDVIIMKSVLGGIFRIGHNYSSDVEHLILEIVHKNLKPGGFLITLDNGKTIFEKLYSNFGARKNRWRYFVPSDFANASRRYYFGFFSAFSFSTRFKRIGSVLDDLSYLLDKIVYFFFCPTNPSVIVSVYERNWSP